MRKKSVEKLNNAIEKFFADLGYEEIRCFLDMDFAYYFDTEEISYTLFELPYADIGFKQYLEKNFPKMPECSIFVISLLHELGHHLTFNDISEKKYNKCWEEKQNLKNMPTDTPEQIIARQFKYCGIYDEKIATEKAVEILIKNYEIISRNEYMIYSAIINFYKDHGMIPEQPVIL